MFALGLALSASSSIMLLIVILGGGFKFVAWDEHAYQSNTVRYPVRGGPRIVDQRIQDIDLYFFHYESKYTLRQWVDGLSMVPHPHAAIYPYAGGDVEAPGKHQLIECDKEGRVSFWLLLLATALSLVPLYLFFGSWKNNQAAETLVRKVSYVRLFYLGLFVLILAPVFTFPSGDCADSIKDEIELMSHSGYHSLKEVALNPGPGRILSCVAATFVVLLCLLNEKITRATKSSKPTSTEQEQEQEVAAENNGFEELKEFFSDPVKRLIMGLVLAGSSSMMLFIVLVGGIFKFVAWNENFYRNDGRGFGRDQYINFFWFEHKYAGGDDGESMVSHPDDCVVEGHISFWLLVLAFLLSSAPLYLFFGSWRNKIASDTLVKKIAYLRASYLLMLALVIAPTFVFKPSKSCSDAIMTEITDRTPSNFWWSNDTYLQEKENNAGTGRVLSYMVAGAVVLLFVLNEVIRRTTQSDSTSKTDTFSVSKEPENNEQENATANVVDTEEAAPDVVVDTEEAVSAVDDNAVVEQAV